MKLFIIPHGKANHFIYGFGKEIYDEWKYGGFYIYDAFYTIAPALILTLKQIYL